MEVETALEHVGDFGRFQAINYLLLCFPVAHTSIYMLTYVFTTMDTPYRCFVPGCDDPETTSEDVPPRWVQHAVPASGSCLRNSRRPPATAAAGCDPEQFSNRTERCDRWVFPAGESTVTSEFEITCEENKWKLTIVGSLLHIGQMVGTPICGLFSDRFGRRSLLMLIMGISWLVGMARSLAPTYGVFIALAFLDATFASGGYSACFILGVELVATRQRVLAGSVVGILSVLGCLYLALVAWMLQGWRNIIRVVYIPAAMAVLSTWLLPESVRWLVSRGRVKDAEEVLARVVRVNRISVAAPIRLQGQGPPSAAFCEGQQHVEIHLDDTAHEGWPVAQVFRSRKLVVRFVVVAAIWIANAFVYFGLAINSVSLAGSVHLNFALSALVEIPAYLLSWAAAERWGRRASLCVALALTGASLIAYLAVPPGLLAWRLALYFAGKLAITASFTVIFVFTAELFPTNARHSLLGLCSTVGRLGSVVAAQTPLLEVYYSGLPVLLFGSAALIGALLTVLLPETINKALPDNVRQAEGVNAADDGGKFTSGVF